MHRLTMAALTVATISACKINHETVGGSDVLFSERAKAAIKDIDLRAERAEICGQDTLIVFVGNGETLGLKAVFPQKGPLHAKAAQIENFYREQAENHVEFVNAMQIAENDLKTQLKVEPCGEAGGTTTLAVIYDGPERDDSRIETTEFDQNGVASEAQRFAFVDKKLDDLKDDKKFELNMAQDVPLLLKALRDRRDKTKPYSQISYFFKSHGANHRGRGGVGNVLLFDTNGPDGELKSNLWFPVWTTEGLYDICGRTRNDKHPQFKFCSSMLSEFVAVSGAGTGGTSGADTGGTSGAGTGGTSGAGTGGTSGAGTGGTSGAGTGGTSGAGTGGTSGAGTGGTSGAGTGGTSGAGTGGTSGAGTGGTSGAGTGGTSGTGTGGTSGTGTGGTSGTGTGGTSGIEIGTGPGGQGDNQMTNYGVEMGEPESSGVTFSETAGVNTPQGYIVLGEAAAYTLRDLPAAAKGISKLTIPVPIKRPDATTRQPMFIVFDACQMSNDIEQSSVVARNTAVPGIGGLGAMDTATGMALTESRGDQPVITLASPEALYFFAMDYGLLSAFHYKALPYIYYWGLPNGVTPDGRPIYNPKATDSIKAGAKLIDEALGSVGLDRDRVIAHHTDPDPEERKKLHPEFLQVRPRVYFLNVEAPQED